MKQKQRSLQLSQEEINALKKACLYSIPPNWLGYCGPKDSFKAFQDFLSNPSQQNALAAKQQLQGFNALFPYLELIASENKLEPFSSEVVEAYWLGNSLLENISYHSIQQTILSLQKHGLPRSIAKKKASNLPNGVLPHHSMHVLFINFINPNVKPLIQNLSNCLIQWGTVQSTTTKGIRVKGVELFSESNQLKLREKIKTVQNPFSLDLKPKDLLTVHWGNAIEKISQDQQKNLKHFTEKTLTSISQSYQ